MSPSSHRRRHRTNSQPIATEFIGQRLGDHAGSGSNARVYQEGSSPWQIPVQRLRLETELAPEKKEFVFLLGQAENDDSMRSWSPGIASPARRQSIRRGEQRLEAAIGDRQVKTPDSAFDLLMNRWLLYQGAELPRVGANWPL